MHDPYRLHMPHWPKSLGVEPPGTPSERARALLARLGHPERRLPPVVHVGGTKGKGSTIAFLRAMLEAAGYKVHAYTSPHLARFHERILLSGREIGDDELHAVLEETRAAAGDRPVGFFDATTAAAMLAFARHPADILLMEMGLGGLVDATNILDAPRLTILTTLSYDHTEYMGKTLPSIAAFEAGLIKPGVPCVVSFQHETAMPVLEQAGKAVGAPLYHYGAHWRVARQAQGWMFSDAHGQALLPPPSLAGPHQIVNAGNAVAALSLLEEFEVGGEAIARGLADARWKGRLERMRGVSLPPGAELWFDGGHNEAAARAVALHVAESWADMPFYLIFGTTEGKEVSPMLEAFAPLAQALYLVPVKSEPRSAAPKVMAKAANGLETRIADSISGALKDCAAEPGPFRALVFGSLYLWLEASQV